MEISRIKILGSSYAGLFGICNDTIAFLPTQISQKTEEEIAKTLDVKTIKTTIYGSALLAVFAKMNNKYIYLPRLAGAREIETIEKEIKVQILPTENAVGNLIEINDAGAIVSNAIGKNVAEEIQKTGLNTKQMTFAKTDITGSALVATNRGFLTHPNTTKEEAKIIEETLEVKGGSSTANLGDAYVRNSVFANKKGIIMGENTTPHEINRIEEALEQ